MAGKTRAFKEGYEAAKEGKSKLAQPYALDTRAYAEWNKGFNAYKYRRRRKI